MALDFLYSRRAPGNQIELAETEIAGAELRAVDGYDNPAFPGEVVTSAAEKARARVSAVYSEIALNGVHVPRWVRDVARPGFEYPSAEADEKPSAGESLTGTLGTDDTVREAQELAEMVDDWERHVANKPEYNEDEKRVLRAALGWRAMLGRDRVRRLESRVARRRYDTEPAERASAVLVHGRYAGHLVSRRLRVVIGLFM